MDLSSLPRDEDLTRPISGTLGVYNLLGRAIMSSWTARTRLGDEETHPDRTWNPNDARHPNTGLFLSAPGNVITIISSRLAWSGRRDEYLAISEDSERPDDGVLLSRIPVGDDQFDPLAHFGSALSRNR